MLSKVANERRCDMYLFSKILFYVSLFIIFWAMVGYPISLRIIKLMYRERRLIKDYSYIPTVTVLVVAHNEEKVIWDKMVNITRLDYPKEKIEFLISSDNSTDKTDELVEKFIRQNPEYRIRLYKVRERRGKTNAQNEAQKTVKSEILVMTDANSMLEKNAVRELVAAFTSDDISYVCGRLVFTNHNANDVARTEKLYWDTDTKLREIESNIQTITAGNGAIYACRNAEYHDFDPINSHDIDMPRFFALKNKRAIFNPDAIAYEKASENIKDEFKRKCRMNRAIIKNILPDIQVLNIYKYRWFPYFYFGHRTCRYLLWISHLILFISNIFLLNSWFFMFTFVSQIIFYILALIGWITNSNRFLKLIFYYCMTIIAQWVGVYKILIGQSKPFWEKAQSTR